MTPPLNWNSKQFTHGWQKGVTAFYYGLGFSEEDFSRPQIGIGVPLLDGNLCNVHAYELANGIKDACQASGLVAFPFGVPGVSDNITQGMEGGNASLPSRNVIANSAEMVTTAHGYDCLIGLHHCDKNGPGFAMALARMNYPGLIISGGSIHPGCHDGKNLTILDVYDSQAQASVGEISQAEADEVLKHACPGPGGCGIAASFNTWGIAMEAIGLMPPNSSSNPAVSSEKTEELSSVGELALNLLKLNLRPRDILTPKAFRNATRAIASAGGSTNGILHLLALAKEAHIDFTLKDIQPILKSTPVLCSFAPRGTKTMVDLHEMGGTSVLLAHLLKEGILEGDAVTVTGKTLAENLSSIPGIPHDQDLIVSSAQAFKDHADMQICFGNLAPEGIVFKVSSLDRPEFEGRAICFDDARQITEAVEQKKIGPGSVVVLRYLGPVASGMPEVLVASAALAVPELDGKVAFISDTRVSGVSHGAIGVHCSPEAQVGGPIALVEDGDMIAFDLIQGKIELRVSESELNTRKSNWKAPSLKISRGYLADFSVTCAQASQGCVSKSSLSLP